LRPLRAKTSFFAQERGFWPKSRLVLLGFAMVFGIIDILLRYAHRNQLPYNRLRDALPARKTAQRHARPCAQRPAPDTRAGPIECKPRLGGLLKFYSRKAA